VSDNGGMLVIVVLLLYRNLFYNSRAVCMVYRPQILSSICGISKRKRRKGTGDVKSGESKDKM
jgi:hypothetical protein